MDKSKFSKEWNQLFDVLSFPTATVGDIWNKIDVFSEESRTRKNNGLNPVLFVEKGTISDGSVGKLDVIMYFFINGDSSETIDKYWNCRYNRNDPDSTYTQNFQTAFDGSNGTTLKNYINEHIKNHPFSDKEKISDAFIKIKTYVSNDPDISSNSNKAKRDKLIKFIDEAFLNPSASNAQSDAPKEGAVLDIVKKAIENSEKKQVIFTGAPGTGKTYSVEEYVKLATQQSDSNNHPNWEFVQFHSSYDYTDFVEGLRPIQKDDKMVFVRRDGIFKAFCRRVAEANKQIDEENARPKEETPNGEAAPKKEYALYYFIIDEINRADLGRVFGELMYCFEKRGNAHSVKTQYHNLPTYDLEKKGYKEKEEDVFAEGFYIPTNVIILGTMNDIDRSVETFDFALRRRFDWVELKADEVMKEVLTAMGCDTDIVGDIKKMNEVIEKQPGLGGAFAIGPAYFKGYKGNTPEERKTRLKTIWERNIKPILLEYMRGRQTEVINQFVRNCESALFKQLPDKQNSETNVGNGEKL